MQVLMDTAMCAFALPKTRASEGSAGPERLGEGLPEFVCGRDGDSSAKR